MYTTAEVMSAGSWVTVMTGSLVAVVYIYRLARGQLDRQAENLALGLILAAIGWAMHRSYWGANRLIESSGQKFTETWLYEYRIWTLAAFVIVIVGYGYHLKPIIEAALGSYSIVKYMVFMVALFFLILFMISYA